MCQRQNKKYQRPHCSPSSGLSVWSSFYSVVHTWMIQNMVLASPGCRTVHLTSAAEFAYGLPVKHRSSPVLPSVSLSFLSFFLSSFLPNFFFPQKAVALPKGWERRSSHWTGQQDIISPLCTWNPGLEHQASQASFFTSLSWSEDQSIKAGLALAWDLCDWLIYCGNGRPFIYGNI